MCCRKLYKCANAELFGQFASVECLSSKSHTLEQWFFTIFFFVFVNTKEMFADQPKNFLDRQAKSDLRQEIWSLCLIFTLKNL